MTSAKVVKPMPGSETKPSRDVAQGPSRCGGATVGRYGAGIKSGPHRIRGSALTGRPFSFQPGASTMNRFLTLLTYIGTAAIAFAAGIFAEAVSLAWWTF